MSIGDTCIKQIKPFYFGNVGQRSGLLSLAIPSLAYVTASISFFPS